MKGLQKNIIIAAISVAFLQACGGGGGDSSLTTPVVTPETPVTTPPVVDLDALFGEYLSDLSTGQIIPGYTALSVGAQNMLAQSTAFCAQSAPQTADLEAVKASWGELVNAWQAIQWVKVGQVVQNNNLFRIQFWPDSNHAVERGVSNLLLEPNTVTVEDVAGQNVGGQGIPALEYLLYQEGETALLSASDRSKRCEVMTAVSQNLVNITSEIERDWSASGNNFADTLITGTGTFTSVQDSVEELVTNWLEHLETVKDEKVLFPLGVQSPGVIEISEHPMGEVSLQAIETNLRVFKDIYTNNDAKGLEDILRDDLEQPQVADDMLAGLESVIVHIEAINAEFDSLEAALGDESGREQLNLIVEDIRVIRDVLSTGFIQALDINIGFNSNDGD